MKKLSRNISLFIIAIVLSFGFSLDVMAEGACGDENNNQCRIGERGVIHVAGNAQKYYKPIGKKLSDATENTRYSVSGTGEYYTNKKGQKVPWNYYKTVDIQDTIGDSGFSSYQDTYSALFCLDAQYEGDKTVYASRFLLDMSENKMTQVMDAAFMSVLLDGGITKDVKDIKTYWAKLLAIRMLTYTFGTYNDAHKDFKNAFYASMNVAYNFNNNYYKADLDALNAALKEAGLETIGGRVEKHDGYNFTGDVVNVTAAGYYTRALAAATKYAKSLSSQAKVDVGTVSAGEVETTGEEGNVFVQKDVVHTIKISGFTKDNKFVINPNNNGIKFADGTQYDGLTAYISNIEIAGKTISGKEQVAAILGKNLVELGYIPEKQDVEIKITAHFEGWKSSTDSRVTTLKCGQQPIKYTIDGTYGTGLPDEYKDYVATIWYSGEKEMQRYLGIEKKTADNGDSGNPWESKYETYLIDSCSCENLISACVLTMNPNSDECIELKESNCGECALLDAYCQMGDSAACDKHDLVCDLTCETEVQTFECCDEAGDLSFLDVSTADDHEVSILGPGPDNTKSNNIKACFVNKMDQLAELQGDGTYKNNTNIEISDQNKNSYALADVKSNQYCSVSCKEDYVMTMPTAKIVNAGRYFTFKAKVEGTKVCYTNTIDREKYNHDIIEKQEAIYKAYNGWIRYQTALESNPHDLPTVTTCGSCHTWCKGQNCDSQITYIPGATTDPFTYTAYYPDFSSGSGQSLKLNPTIEHGPEDDTTVTHSETNSSECTCYRSDGNGGQVSYGCTITCSYTVVDEVRDVSYLIKRLTNLRDQYKHELDEAISAYNETIKEYNECSGWKTEINYDPEVYYDYVEDYMNLLNNRMGQMDKVVTSPSNSEWYCNGRTTLNSFTFGSLYDKDYEQCSNSNTSYNAPKMQYVMCSSDTRKCYFDPDSYVSEASYKKITSSITGNYKPATLFYNVYPSGEITVNKGDDNVALENKLPVALNTPRGIYKYTVNIENLGEFYDQAPKGNLGRYVGSSTAIADPKTLVYNCAYLVNITTTTGWICDFDETCTDDCISNCVGPDCDGYCDGIDCVADCIGLGCIYDSAAGTSLIERLVSLNNLFPNGTSSYNWDKSRNDKALKTITSIESEGNAIYDKDPILSITITPGAANEIRKYNNDVLDDGGYSNDTVSCRDRNGVEQIACYSDVLTDIINGEFGKIVNNNSLILDDNYRFGENSEYFKLWDGRISEDDMIGPAWR